MPKEGGGCRNCGSSDIDKELAQGQHLCVPCLKSLPRISCHFCTVTYQQLPEAKRNSKIRSDVCFFCEQKFLKFGQPKACACCANNAAFALDHYCKLCASAIAKYGNPVPCSKCQRVRAFDRPDKRAELQGRNYFSCARAIKSESQSSADHKKPKVSALDSHRSPKSKERVLVKDSQDKVRPSTSDRSKRPRGDDSSSSSLPEPRRAAAAESRELEITGLRRRVQEADDRAARLEARCKQLELECQESKQKHAVSIKELDSYVCVHNMEKYQSKSRETEWKSKLSMLQAEHSRLKSDFANLEAAVEIKIQNEVSVWRSRVAQLEDELRDVSRELKQLRS
jgi:predicted  nucleic acid-binding Zn-ribbon protein